MGNVDWLFGNPFLKLQFDKPKLNEQLKELITGLEKEHTGLRQSNRGGWQSEKTLQTIKSLRIEELLSMIDVGVRQMTSNLCSVPLESIQPNWDIVAWANINRKSHYNKLHYHVGGFWSGVYYVDTPVGNSEDEGNILLKNSNQTHMLANVIRAPFEVKRAFCGEIQISPRAGMLILFPSWFEHAVAPHSVEAERISIGFDILYRRV